MILYCHLSILTAFRSAWTATLRSRRLSLLSHYSDRPDRTVMDIHDTLQWWWSLRRELIGRVLWLSGARSPEHSVLQRTPRRHLFAAKEQITIRQVNNYRSEETCERYFGVLHLPNFLSPNDATLNLELWATVSVNSFNLVCIKFPHLRP